MEEEGGRNQAWETVNMARAAVARRRRRKGWLVVMAVVVVLLLLLRLAACLLGMVDGGVGSGKGTKGMDQSWRGREAAVMCGCV